MPQQLRPRWQQLQPKHRPATTGNTRRLQGDTWMRLRAKVLADEPRCRPCLEAGRPTLAEEVDHIQPLSEGGTHDRVNLQGICRDCHKAKTDEERRRRLGQG
jgi:5-methylcytosine-specific restriction protein A